MTERRKIDTEENRAAIGFMLIAVLIFSLIPLVIDISGGTEHPFLFNAAWKIGIAAGCLSFLAIRYPRFTLRAHVLRTIGYGMFCFSMLLVIVGRFNIALFALAMQFIDVSVAAILFETWPLFLIPLTAWLFRGESRYRKITPTTFSLLILGFAGFGFVVISQPGEIKWNKDDSSAMLIVGVLLAVAGSMMTAMTSFLYKWSSTLSKEINKNAPTPQDTLNESGLVLFCVVAGFAISNILSAFLNVGVGVAREEVADIALLKIGLIAGTVSSIAGICLRWSNMITKNLGVNAISFATPIFALLWLWFFSRVGVANSNYLVIGAAAIIAANILINFEAEIRLGFKAMVLALWACGAFVILRADEWLWENNSYFNTLALAATLFILILSFRVERLVRRTSQEETAAFAISHKLKNLTAAAGASDGKDGESVLDRFIKMDASENQNDLQDAYQEIKESVGREHDKAENDPARRREIGEIEAMIDAHAHSKQQGINFSELAALLVFAAITAGLAMLSRPAELAGWGGFLVEAFTTLLAALVVFLFFNVLDLQRDRRAPILAKTERPPKPGQTTPRIVYGVAFRDPAKRIFERWLSVILCAAIAAAYGYLLWDKWLG